MEDQGHDRKCNRSSAFSCCSSNEGANDHGDGHGVVSWEVCKVVFLNRSEKKHYSLSQTKLIIMCLKILTEMASVHHIDCQKMIGIRNPKALRCLTNNLSLRGAFGSRFCKASSWSFSNFWPVSFQHMVMYFSWCYRFFSCIRSS